MLDDLGPADNENFFDFELDFPGDSGTCQIKGDASQLVTLVFLHDGGVGTSASFDPIRPGTLHRLRYTRDETTGTCAVDGVATMETAARNGGSGDATALTVVIHPQTFTVSIKYVVVYSAP